MCDRDRYHSFEYSGKGFYLRSDPVIPGPCVLYLRVYREMSASTLARRVREALKQCGVASYNVIDSFPTMAIFDGRLRKAVEVPVSVKTFVPPKSGLQKVIS